MTSEPVRRLPRRPPSALPARVAGVCAAALLLSLTACAGSAKTPEVASVGSTGPTASASASTDRTGQLLEFASCMRLHGVNVPDPQPGAQNVQLPAGTKGDSSTQQALQTCQHFLGGGGKTGTDPTAQARSVALAQCLRKHGLDVPDPQPGQPLRLTGAGDPRTEQAVLACRSAGASASASTGG